MRFIGIVLFIACPWWPALGAALDAAQTNTIADTMVRLCVGGGRTEATSGTGSGGADLSLRSLDVTGNLKGEFKINKSSAEGLVKGLDSALSQVAADQADKVRVCLQPVRERLLDVMLPPHEALPTDAEINGVLRACSESRTDQVDANLLGAVNVWRAERLQGRAKVESLGQVILSFKDESIRLEAYKIYIQCLKDFLGKRGLSQPATKLPSIYLARVIDPPGNELAPTKSTIWVSSTGDAEFTLDSIEVSHHPGNCYSMGDTETLPVADYAFHFSYGSWATHALSPALRLGPGTSKNISFTLALAPSGSFTSVCGYVSAKLYYHGSDGSNGRLEIDQERADGLFLASVLDTEIAIIQSTAARRGRGRVYSPSGAVREVTREDKIPPLIYSPVDFDAYDGKVHFKFSEIDFRSRELLNYALQDSETAIPALVSEVPNQRGIAISLCATIPDKRCEDALRANTGNDEQLRVSAHFLALRHLVRPTNSLAEFVLSHAEKIGQSHFNYMDVMAALARTHTGNWAHAMLSIAENKASARELLYASRYDLDLVSLNKLQEILVAKLDEHIAAGKLDNNDVILAVKFLLATQGPQWVENLLQDLSVHEPLPSGITTIRDTFGAQLLANAIGVPVSVDWLYGGRPISVSAEPHGGWNGSKEASLRISMTTLGIYLSNVKETAGSWTHYSNRDNWIKLRTEQERDAVRDVAKEYGFGGFWAIQLMAGSDRPGDARALKELCSDTIRGQSALAALAVRHVAISTPDLADCAIGYAKSNAPEIKKSYASREVESGAEAAVIALAARREGSWSQALVELATLNGSHRRLSFEALGSYAGLMSPEMSENLKKVMEKFWLSLSENDVPEVMDAAKISLQLGMEPDIIRPKVLKIEQHGSSLKARDKDELRRALQLLGVSAKN
jgi:hypothetical protein